MGRPDSLPGPAIALSALLIGCFAPPVDDIRIDSGAQVTADGLHRLADRDDSMVFVKPGADLQRFTRVRMDPVVIRYTWRAEAGRDARERLDSRMQERLAQTFDEVFEDELRRSEVYALVDEPGPDVLRVNAELVDLDVRAPIERANRDEFFIESAGSLTLQLELSDSVSGETILRVAQRRSIRNANPQTLYRSSSTTNLSDTRLRFRHWAKRLRAFLDEVREIPPLPAEPDS